MVRRHQLIALSALLILQFPVYAKDQHSHLSAGSRANSDLKNGIKKSAAHKAEALPIAVQKAHDSKTSASDSKDADDSEPELLEPDGNEDPDPPAGALYTYSDDTG